MDEPFRGLNTDQSIIHTPDVSLRGRAGGRTIGTELAVRVVLTPSVCRFGELAATRWMDGCLISPHEEYWQNNLMLLRPASETNFTDEIPPTVGSAD